MASGDLPDFAGVSDTVYKLLVEMGAVADCTQLWNEKISDEYKALLGQNAVEQMTYDGQLLGLPWPTKGYHGANLLYVRQDWLDKLGLSYPQTWEEIVEVATAFQQAKLGGEGTLGLVSGFSSLTPISSLMNVFGAQLDYWVERDGKLAWSNIQPEMRTALLEIQKLYATGVLNPDVAVATDDLLKEYIASKKAGIFHGCSYLPTMVLNTLPGSQQDRVTQHHLGVDFALRRTSVLCHTAAELYENPAGSTQRIGRIGWCRALAYHGANYPSIMYAKFGHTDAVYGSWALE